MCRAWLEIHTPQYSSRRKYASGAEAPPEAILWCDPGEEFVPVLPMLRARQPNLLQTV